MATFVPCCGRIAFEALSEPHSAGSDLCAQIAAESPPIPLAVHALSPGTTEIKVHTRGHANIHEPRRMSLDRIRAVEGIRSREQDIPRIHRGSRAEQVIG